MIAQDRRPDSERLGFASRQAEAREDEFVDGQLVIRCPRHVFGHLAPRRLLALKAG
jgi:hypothetical protein